MLSKQFSSSTAASKGATLYRTDITFMFGLTMWIHLNHGDVGLMNVLQNIINMTRKTIVIEIHTWKNYKSAIKRIKKLKMKVPTFWKPIQNSHGSNGGPEKLIDTIMKKNHCYQYKHFGNTGWGREVCSYEKKV
jgi:hypothetical protein